ncbi:uncharacterized protein LOC141535798 isoform X2 [Cotesia typhae]|uniref:uncharacterized protein LOC141535798 isoform X2 n=1 Tax=Cotesia typhae TaxID=2053667 RepID=UPI003D69947C
MKEEEIKDFILSEKCQNQNACTHQITVFFFCKRNGFSQQLIKSLTRLWKCSFLNVYTMCLGSMNKITVYTFNPYSGRELLKWTKYEPKTKKMRDKIRRNMSCYSRLYLKDNICDGFDFDRTKYLDNSKVMAVVGSQLPDTVVGIANFFEKTLNIIIVQKQPTTKYVSFRIIR